MVIGSSVKLFLNCTSMRQCIGGDGSGPASLLAHAFDCARRRRRRGSAAVTSTFTDANDTHCRFDRVSHRSVSACPSYHDLLWRCRSGFSVRTKIRSWPLGFRSRDKDESATRLFLGRYGAAMLPTSFFFSSDVLLTHSPSIKIGRIPHDRIEAIERVLVSFIIRNGDI